jgi:hypothetical protein
MKKGFSGTTRSRTRGVESQSGKQKSIDLSRYYQTISRRERILAIMNEYLLNFHDK